MGRIAFSSKHVKDGTQRFPDRWENGGFVKLITDAKTLAYSYRPLPVCLAECKALLTQETDARACIVFENKGKVMMIMASVLPSMFTIAGTTKKTDKTSTLGRRLKDEYVVGRNLRFRRAKMVLKNTYI